MKPHNYYNHSGKYPNPEYKYLLPKDFEVPEEPVLLSDGAIAALDALRGFWNETEYQLRLAGVSP